MKSLNVVAAIIIYDNKILCMQRGTSKYEYTSKKFEFPGGKVESGESYPVALMRELHEELDIDISISERDHAITVYHEYPDFDITMHCYYCHPKSSVFTRKEHIDHKWLTIEDLSSLDWAAADIPVVQFLQKSRGKQ